MLLESLKQFDWLNEPYHVQFDEKGMRVLTKYRTDFWNCARYDFQKDDGHFFYNYAFGDFCLDLNWEFEATENFDQCGVMARVDTNNWFKASIMSEDDENPMLATCLTNNGYSDLATIALPKGTKRVWYRIKRRKWCYVASYSLDGEDYIQLRKFYLENDIDDVKVGAYICSPQREGFEAILKDIVLVNQQG